MTDVATWLGNVPTLSAAMQAFGWSVGDVDAPAVSSAMFVDTPGPDWTPGGAIMQNDPAE